MPESYRAASDPRPSKEAATGPSTLNEPFSGLADAARSTAEKFSRGLVIDLLVTITQVLAIVTMIFSIGMAGARSLGLWPELRFVFGSVLTLICVPLLKRLLASRWRSK